MSDELKLLDCPFCGGKPRTNSLGWVACWTPGCPVDSIDDYIHPDAWNRRAPSAELAELRKALESIASGITGDMLGTVSMTTEDMKSIARRVIAKGGVG